MLKKNRLALASICGLSMLKELLLLPSCDSGLVKNSTIISLNPREIKTILII